MNLPLSKLTAAAAVTAVAATVLLTSGCASAKINVLTKAGDNVVEPDFVLVKSLAVTPKDVELDRGVITKAVNDSGNTTQTQQEIQVGEAAAKAFSASLVADLRKAGLRAAGPADGLKPTDRTVIVSGKFIRIDQGNRTMRVLIGFGFGNGDLKAMLDFTQNGKLIARAVVTTSGGYKPGIAVPVAGGAAAGTLLVSSAVAGGTTAVSETFMTTVQADVARAAKDVAKKIVQAYINRHWASPDAISKLDALF